MAIIKGIASVIGRMTVLGMVAVQGMAPVLRMLGSDGGPHIYGLSDLSDVHKIWDRQTN